MGGVATKMPFTFITMLAATLSLSGAPLFLNKTIDLYGHSKSMVIMAIIFGFGIAALGWFFYRDNPEECGLIMDGKKISSEKSAFATEEPETTLKEALKTYNFWIFSFGLCSASLIITGFTFHISSIGALAGLSRFESYSIFLPIALISMISHFIAGWASDRMPLKYILIVMLFGLTLGSIGMSNLNTVSCRVLVIFGFGLQGGIWPCLFTVTWPRFYGRKYLGSISGLVMGAQVFASAIGPPVFGLSQNIYGSYSPIAIFLTGLNLLLIIGAFRAVSYYRG